MPENKHDTYPSIRVRFTHINFWGKPHEVIRIAELIEREATLLLQKHRITQADRIKLDKLTDDLTIARNCLRQYDLPIAALTTQGIDPTIMKTIYSRTGHTFSIN